MRRHRQPDVLRDPEVLELLREEPELLAIADAIHATIGKNYRRRRRRARAARGVLLAALAAGAATVALLQPWRGGGGGLVAQALAAIPGRGPVVHALLERPVPGVQLVELRSGRVFAERVELEFWFDPHRKLLHTLVRRQGVVVADILTSPGTTLSAAGPVLGLQSSLLDPALVAFASGYRRALASGAARPVGRTLAGGRATRLLELNTRFGREQVELDPRTLRPRAVRPLLSVGRPGGQTAHVLALASLPAGEANFAQPLRAQPVPAGGAAEASTPLTPTAARSALGRPALWVGRSLAGLPLRLVERQRLVRFFPPGARARRSVGVGLVLLYGAVRNGLPDWRSRFVELQEATGAEPGYGFLSGALRIEPPPPRGLLRLERRPLAGSAGRAIWRGELRLGGLYLALTGSSRALVLAAARALRPIPTPVS